MRVALHFPDGSVAAYKLGRIVAGTHTTDLITGVVTPVEDIAAALVAQAEEEYPMAEVVVERWKDNGDGTSTWVPADSDEAPASPAPSEVVEAPVIQVTQDTSLSDSTGQAF